MKKFLVILSALILIFASSCGKSETHESNSNDNKKIRIMSTIFPIYDMCREIVGDDNNIELSWLLDNGVDLHNFNPTADDIINIGKQDLFLYIGGESDKWVNELNNIKGKKIALMDTIKDFLKVEEIKEGMEVEEHEHEHGHEHEHEHEEHEHEHEHEEHEHEHEEQEHEHADHAENNGHHHDEEEIEYDEHIWLSLKNMKELARVLTDEIIKLNPNNSSVYTKNSINYIKKLDELDKEYAKVFDMDGQYVMLFADRFPFRYMTSDYNIEYFAAFLGCSAETEASFKTIKFLTDKLDEYKLKTIWVLEGSDRKIANTIINNAINKNVSIAELNSLQSVDRKDDENGATYINIITKNLDVLKEEIGK